MKQLSLGRDIAAPASIAWSLLTDIGRWPQWGPSIRSARIDDESLRLGTLGTVTTVVGISLPFEVTSFVPDVSWGWKVGGIRATDHIVEALAEDRCRVTITVPFVAAPYLGICAIALRRIEQLAMDEVRGLASTTRPNGRPLN